jgi:hypothetical protein
MKQMQAMHRVDALNEDARRAMLQKECSRSSEFSSGQESKLQASPSLHPLQGSLACSAISARVSNLLIVLSGSAARLSYCEL